MQTLTLINRAGLLQFEDRPGHRIFSSTSAAAVARYAERKGLEYARDSKGQWVVLAQGWK